MTYYTNINHELLSYIPVTARRILEVGCGAGNFGRACQARNPTVSYTAVELFEGVARQAAVHLNHVIVGDIEQRQTLEALDKVCQGALFDVLVFGDVLEHLRDPWRVLADLRSRVAPNGVCVVCIPNVSHWSLLAQQLKGRWDYADAGILDRTHLRFFTLETTIEMIKQAGWQIDDAKPRILWPEKTDAMLKAFAPLSESLAITPEKLRSDLSAFQWVLRAVNGTKPEPLTVAALGMKKEAGVREARVDYPLAALSTLPAVRTVCGHGNVTVPGPPGVLILARVFLKDEVLFNEHFGPLIHRGWVIVHDIDDDPHHWEELVGNNFRHFRSVHAVTVSTEPLAQIMREWNPNVRVFPNAIFQLPDVEKGTPKQGTRLRVFFGAINRQGDWGAVMDGIIAAAQKLANAVEFVVVHDQAFSDALPVGALKTFYPTLPHDKYMQVLSSCDLALLPLADTQFNRIKSDLKFIECCAAGVVPICSAVVYAERAEHREIGLFAETVEEWRQTMTHICSTPAEIVRRRTLGLAYVKRERMHCHQVSDRENYYRSLLAQRDSLETQRLQRLKALS